MIKVKKKYIAIFLIPGILIYLFVYAVPLVTLVSTSFTQWKIGADIAFNGFTNYIELFQDKDGFHHAFFNTLIWIFLQATVHVFIGVTVALILSRRKFYWKFVRSVYMIPNVISAAALGMMYRLLFNANFGAVNEIIQFFGAEGFQKNWYFDSGSAFWTVTAAWLPFAGTVMLLVMAEIAAIDPALMEAARIDGASEGQIITRITLPLLRNIIATCMILGGTSMLQKLDIIMMTTNGGPMNRTLNLPLFIYQTALRQNNFGLANSAGVCLILIGVIFVLLVQKIFRVGTSDI